MTTVFIVISILFIIAIIIALITQSIKITHLKNENNLSENHDVNIGYTEYLAENLNTNTAINYITYSEYVAECANPEYSIYSNGKLVAKLKFKKFT